MLIVLGGLSALVGFVCFIILLIGAFKDEIWKGIVGLFCGLYLLYYGIVEFDAPNKLWILGGYVFGNLIASALFRASAASHGVYNGAYTH